MKVNSDGITALRNFEKKITKWQRKNKDFLNQKKKIVKTPFSCQKSSDVGVTLKIIERDLNWMIPSIRRTIVEDLRDDFVHKNILDYKSDEGELTVGLKERLVFPVSEIRTDH